MGDKKKQQRDRMAAYAKMLEKQAGKAVRPYRADGYVNLLNRYGTSKDSEEAYHFVPEVTIPDESLTLFYEGNGLFAKIIDAPAEEALKHGFELEDVSDQEVEDFFREALDELDWEETAMTAIKWARLFGGSLAVMLINDGRGLEEPLDWKNIKSIDDIRVYDRSVIQPDYESMFNYDPRDPFRTRGSRLGMPETYSIYSRYGNFTVHESRCLVFQNGLLPENSSNSIYQFWGMPEYIRINKAIQDAEISHRSAPKMLNRSVQPVYKMKDLAAELATEEGENKVLRRLQTIDMARGLMNSITIDSEGEDYDFRTFQFTGVSDVIDSACNYLSALTNIPQTILFGRSPAGMNATGESDLENWYSYVERIQKRMLKGNLRYLLSVIFQAGVATGEVDEVPKIKVKFNPLWTLSEIEQADLDQKKAQTAQARAQTAQIYVDMQAIDPSEVRRKLADSSEFDVETMLDEYDDEDDLLAAYSGEEATEFGGSIPQSGDFAQYASGVDIERHNVNPGTEGSTPAEAPAATKLPQDMSAEELAEVEQNSPKPEQLPPEAYQDAVEAEQKAAKVAQNNDTAAGYSNTQGEGKPFSVGVLVISDGKVLTGTRHNDFGYGLICGPGGHGEAGETPEQAAFRETEEEFGISPKSLIPLGRGPKEPDTGLTPYLFLCTDYEGEPDCVDLEMTNAKFRTMQELDDLASTLFQPFADGLDVLTTCIDTALFFGDDEGEMHDDLVENIGQAISDDPEKEDGGPGSGNFGHSGREGQVGGSEERSGNSEPYVGETSHGLPTGVYSAKKAEWSRNASRQLSDDEVKEMVDATADYTRNYKDVVAASAGYEGVYASRGSLMDDEEKAEAEKSAETIEKMISLSDKYEGTAERAMTMDRDTFDQFAQAAATGEPFGLGHLSSWTTEENGLKRVFNSRNSENDPEISNVVLECQSKSGVSIKNMAEVDMDEVLFSKDARFRVTSIDPEFSVGKYGAVKFTLEEIEDNEDGGPGSGNHGHEGVPGKVGGSAPSITESASKLLHSKSEDYKADFLSERGMRFREIEKAISSGKLDDAVDEKLKDVAKERRAVADAAPDVSNIDKSAEKLCREINGNDFETLISFDKDGNEVNRQTGTATGVDYSREGSYSTLHNHPGDKDSSFSGDDVRSFASTDEQVMYMASTEKLYSLQKGKDYDGYSAKSVATHIETLEKRFADGEMTREELIAEADLYLQLHAHEFGLVYKQQDIPSK